MKKVHTAFILLILACLTLFSCKKKSEEETPQPVVVPPPTVLDKDTISFFKLELAHKAGTQNLVFNTTYTNSSGETFKVATLRYLISKVKLKKADNTEISLPDYFLVDASAGRPLTVPNVPYGSYTNITYSIGVDSLTNTLGAQSGALDAISSMYWPWDGYKSLELLGTSLASKANGGVFQYHISGFRKPYQTEQIITHSFGTSALTVKKDSIPFVRISVDLLELFKSPVDISIATTYNVETTGVDAKKIADNYQDMFTFDVIHY